MTRYTVFGASEGSFKDNKVSGGGEVSWRGERREAWEARREARRERREYRREYSSGSGVFGVFMALAGLVLLLNMLRIVPWEFWNIAGMFWPVLIVLVGLQIVLGHNILARIAMPLISLAVLGFLALYILHLMNSPLLSQATPELMQAFTKIDSLRY
jgi:hypothetical protein